MQGIGWKGSFCVFSLLMVSIGAFGALTHLNEMDKHPTLVLSADGLGVAFTEWGHRAVRSDKFIAPGSGFYYFEGRRELATANYGFGLATAAAPLDMHGGATDQSLGCNVLGTCLYDATWQGNLSGTQDTYGFAVDYRGANPIVHIIVSQTLAGPGEYLHSITLSNITTPLAIFVYGNNSHGVVQQTINAGDDLGPRPFRYDPIKALTEAYFVPIDGIDELVLGWGEPDPSLNQFPEVTPGPARTVIVGNPITVNASANDVEDGNLTGSISWSDSDSAAVGSGPGFTITPASTGVRTLTASVTDSNSASATATVMLTVIANGSIDSDGDGLSYDDEIAFGTDPSAADSDGDGLLDGPEVLFHGTNPNSGDSDGDGMDDQYEALCGLFSDRDDSGEDPDDDGYTNGAEHQAGSEPLNHLSYPGLGEVKLNPVDRHPAISLSADGLGVSVSGGGMAAVRSDVSIQPGSGWFYYEGRRMVSAGNFGFGVASGLAPLDQAGGATDQSVGVHTLGEVRYNGAQVGAFADPNLVEFYGLAVDYSGATPIVYPMVSEDTFGKPVLLAGVNMTSVTSPLYIFVFGASAGGGIQQIMNAGAEPDEKPFRIPAHYHLFVAGTPGAEFMGSGWGPDHAYSGRPTVRQFDPVILNQDESTGEGISLGPEKLGASYSINLKMAIRANQGMIGQFRYFEAHRSVGPYNIGQGLITEYAFINHYCCVTPNLSGAPPSMSVNSSSSIWRNLVSQASYNTSNTYYGFAVDYRGPRPIVHVIIGNALVHSLVLDDIFTPIFPMLYGNTQGPMRTNTANFGTSPFQYDARQILSSAGVNTTGLILGWGDANDEESPRINAQNTVCINEDVASTIQLGDLVVADPNDSYPTGFSLTVLDGSRYTRVGNAITPEPEYSGKLAVPVKVNDGVFDSNVFKLIVKVEPVNDPPIITGQNPLSTPEETALIITLADLVVTDVDNAYPAGFSLMLQNGSNYSVVGTTLTPALDFNGTLTVPVTVNDGVDDSGSFNLQIEVTPVNDPPVITGQNPLSTPEETALALDLAAVTVTDPDNAFPTGYSLTVMDGVDYARVGNAITPAEDFNGFLTVPVLVNDGSDDSPVFNLQVEVTPLNDPPEITGQASVATLEETERTVVIGDLVIDDPDNVFPGDFSLTVMDGANYSRSGAAVTPDLDFNGVLSVPVRVNDGEIDSPNFLLQITVTPVNDPPAITGQAAPLDTPEETDLTLTPGALVVTDPDNAFPADFTISIADGPNYTHAGAVLTPDLDFNGFLTVPVTVNDGADDSGSFNLQIEVTPVNDPPVITGQAPLSTPEETPVALSLADLVVSDPDSAFPAGFSLSIMDGSNYAHSGLTITPALDFNGTLQVRVTVNDGDDDSAPSDLQLEVSPVNDPPQITGQNPLSTPEETPLMLGFGDLIVNDPDNIYPSGFTMTIGAGPNYSHSGTTITPDVDFNGGLTVPVTLNDGTDDSLVFDLSIDITPVNDPPSIAAQAVPLTTAEETDLLLEPGHVSVVDPDNDFPADFTLEILAGPNYDHQGAMLTPSIDFNGVLNVAVRVNDGSDDSPPFSLSVTVEPVNDPPTITGQKSIGHGIGNTDHARSRRFYGNGSR